MKIERFVYLGLQLMLVEQQFEGKEEEENEFVGIVIDNEKEIHVLGREIELDYSIDKKERVCIQ